MIEWTKGQKKCIKDVHPGCHNYLTYEIRYIIRQCLTFDRVKGLMKQNYISIFLASSGKKKKIYIYMQYTDIRDTFLFLHLNDLFPENK